MKRAPTFEQLRERRELPVIVPETGVRFRISLWDWEGVLWGVRVLPDKPRPSDADNEFVQSHRMVSRSFIEEWLARLRLASTPRPPRPPRARQHQLQLCHAEPWN
jgi:hypothetical protein